MNTCSQQQQEQQLHESSVNRLYECKTVKIFSWDNQICIDLTLIRDCIDVFGLHTDISVFDSLNGTEEVRMPKQ